MRCSKPPFSRIANATSLMAAAGDSELHRMVFVWNLSDISELAMVNFMPRRASRLRKEYAKPGR